MSKIAWMLTFLILGVSCSGPKTSSVAQSETPQIDLSGSDDFNNSEDPIADISETTEGLTETTTPETDSSLLSLDAGDGAAQSAAPEITAEDPTTQSTEVGEYVVQKNETLMMISFKLYGDYSKWRSLAKMNKKHIKNGIVMAGKTIRYNKPSVEFNWQPQGNPYLIKNGDTLGKISNDVYGTQKKWKAIWENNRPLIKDPNQIFAGFTIFYQDQGSVAASEKSTLEL